MHFAIWVIILKSQFETKWMASSQSSNCCGFNAASSSCCSQSVIQSKCQHTRSQHHSISEHSSYMQSAEAHMLQLSKLLHARHNEEKDDNSDQSIPPLHTMAH